MLLTLPSRSYSEFLIYSASLHELLCNSRAQEVLRLGGSQRFANGRCNPSLVDLALSGECDLTQEEDNFDGEAGLLHGHAAASIKDVASGCLPVNWQPQPHPEDTCFVLQGSGPEIECNQAVSTACTHIPSVRSMAGFTSTQPSWLRKLSL